MKHLLFKPTQCILVSFLSVSELFATDRYGKYGRDYSLDDSVSSHSSGFYIICFIIGIILAIALITMVQKEDNKDKGCITVFIVGIVIIGFLCLTALIG